MPTESGDSSSGATAGEPQTQITVVNRQLNIKPFVISTDSNDTAVRWTKWKTGIERQFRFFGLADPQTKKDGLIIYGGEQISDLEDSLPDPPPMEDDDEYQTLIRKLDQHFLPRKNKDYARFQFGNLVQETGESMAKYYARIREISKKCEFTDDNEAIRDHLIKTMLNNRLRVKTIRNNWTLTQILDEAAVEEEARTQAKEINEKIQATTDIQKVKFISENCGRCGSKHEKRQCPAYGVECHKCGKRNHYARVCTNQGANNTDWRKAKTTSPRTPHETSHQLRPRQPVQTDQKHRRREHRPRRIRYVEEENIETESSDLEQEESSDSEQDDDIQRIVQHMRIHYITRQDEGTENKCQILINGTQVEMEPDTGAGVNVMDEDQFNALLREKPELKLRKSTIKLKTLKADLPVLGECDVRMENKTRTTQATIAIIQGTIDSRPLLGRKTLEDLGMIKFDATGGLKEPNRDIKTIIAETGNAELDTIVLQHKSLCEGIGKAQRDGADIEIRHPLPETGNDHLEKHVKTITEVDHAVVLDEFREATAKDQELQQLAAAITTGKWNKTDPVLAAYHDVRAELYMAEGVMLRLDRIIPPESLRDKIIRTAHKQGHLGISKTKQMLRRKYWFPAMNRRIEEIVSTCFSCQVSTNTYHTEPAKMTDLPARPWEAVEADFCGPFPHGEYALVLTDQYSRYPEVEFLHSTSLQPTRKKMKKMFATHGTPKKVQTDNGPPFNSKEFKEFAAEMGFHHKTVTPRHPKAQGQVEGFNKLINKTATIANQEGLDLKEATYDMLQAYRDTPHPATKATPYELIMNRHIRTKLDHFPAELHPMDEQVRANDSKYKQQVKQYHDNRHKTTEHKIQVGNAVVVKRETRRKAETPFEPHVYIVTGIKGSTIYARRLSDGKTVCRDASRIKPIKTRNQHLNDETVQPQRIQVPTAQGEQPAPTQHNPTDKEAARTAPAQPDQPRRSTRNRASVFDGHLRDYAEH